MLHLAVLSCTTVVRHAEKLRAPWCVHYFHVGRLAGFCWAAHQAATAGTDGTGPRVCFCGWCVRVLPKSKGACM